MKTTNYIGFNGDLCTCGYVLGDIDGVQHLVLAQLPGSTTSITNLVETIVTQLLARDLFGIDATKMRVFEFYSTSMGPRASWQEVTFTIAQRKPRRTVVESIIEFFKPTEQPYVVWEPEWHPVTGALQQKLSALDPALR